MSGVLRALGKAFKAVVKVAKVVLPIALGAAAVIFTGGAALGLLPTFSAAIGGLVGSLGLSTTLAGALTGSIVSAGFGAAAGGLTGGLKGAQKGALFGAASGGILGAVSPATFGFSTTGALKTAAQAAAGVGDAGSAVANAASKGLLSTAVPGLTDIGTASGIAPIANSVGPGIAPSESIVPSAVDAAKTGAGAVPASASVAAPVANVAPSAADAAAKVASTTGAGYAAPAAAGTAAPAAATVAAPANGTGLLNGLLSNPNALVMGGNLLTGLFTPSAAQEAASNGNRLFGDTYSGGAGFGTPANYGIPHVGVALARQFRLNPQTLQVEEVQGR